MRKEGRRERGAWTGSIWSPVKSERVEPLSSGFQVQVGLVVDCVAGWLSS